MSDYYGILLLILAILQDEVKGYFGGFMCSVVAFTNADLVNSLGLFGYNVFQSTLLIDSLCISIVILIASKSKVFYYLLSAFGISALLNLTMIFSSDSLYYMIQPYYGNINIILFEIMVMGLFLHSTIYPKLKTFCTPYTEPFCDLAREYERATKPITRQSHDTE